VSSKTYEINESVYAPCGRQQSLFSTTRSLFCAATIPVPNQLVAEQQRLKMPAASALFTFWTAATGEKSLLNSLLAGNWLENGSCKTGCTASEFAGHFSECIAKSDRRVASPAGVVPAHSCLQVEPSAGPQGSRRMARSANTRKTR
jgi:hypothetical protein